ncbi:MAG: DrmB family protein [bacterium]
MNFQLSNNQRKKTRVPGTLRRTQIVTTHGPGSIVDFPNDSVIIAGVNYWNHYKEENSIYKIGEHNLEKLLGVDYFVLPKADESEYSLPYHASKDIPAFRFPEILFCSNSNNKDCGNIAHYSKFNILNKPVCPKCGSALIPSRFVVACENGHLDDFPYSWWVHRGEPEKCDNPDILHIYYDTKSGGLESIKIRCRKCGKVRSMAGCFAPNALKKYKCNGNRPWLGKKENESCRNTLVTLQRGASNIFFPVHASALSLPPWSSKIQLEIDKYADSLGAFWEDDKLLEAFVKSKKLNDIIGCNIEKIIEEIKRKFSNKTSKEEITYRTIYEDEYKKLIGDSQDDEEFKTLKVEVPEFINEYIDEITLVKKLREVMALCGFKRINPEYNLNDDSTYTGVSKYKKGYDDNGNSWLPAIELRGEGIFIKFNNQKLRDWSLRLEERYNSMHNQLEQSFISRENFSPSYVLLHTFSHLLIRELVLKCGYSSSALKEKIYCTFSEDNALEMNGILIYTSTSDSDGSLGGLVKEGETGRMEYTLRSLLENSFWCSSDPICIQSTGQGIDSLNYAACHSCALLPETSCECSNTLLDRAALVGTINDKKIGFFSSLYN